MIVKRKGTSDGYTVVEILICVAVLGMLALFGGFAWVVIHFLLKVW